MALQSVYTTIFKHQLDKLGYTGVEVNWSLSYCQGDGVSFTGKLDLKALAKRLCPGVCEAVWDGLADDFEPLELTRDSGMRYVHERSTSLNYNAQCLEGTAPEEWGGPAQKVALKQLLEKLEDDIVNTGSELASLGYKLHEVSSFDEEIVRSIQTENFRVEISKMSDDDWELDFVFGEETPLDEVIADLEAEKYEIAQIKVRVLQIDEDGEEVNELHELIAGGIQYFKDGPVFGKGTAREFVSEAIREARDAFAKQRRVTLKAA